MDKKFKYGDYFVPESECDINLITDSRDMTSLHLTTDGLVSINVGGSVHAMSLQEWHKRAESFIKNTDESMTELESNLIKDMIENSDAQI